MSGRPYWMRNHMACPDCGYIYHTAEHLAEHTVYKRGDWSKEPDPEASAIDCPSCGSHWTYADWWQEQYDKWSRTMKEDL